MSRRKQQQIRNIQRATGASYRQAGRIQAGSPKGTGGTGGRGDAVGGDGWPPSTKDPVVGVVIDAARSFVGNSLPEAATPAICAELGIEFDPDAGDVMVTKVTAAPDVFPDIESSLIEEYEDGLEMHEVTLGMDVDVELVGLPVAVAIELVASNPEGSIADQENDWATVAVPALPLQITAQVRFEFESVEISDQWVSVRDQ